MTDLSHEILPFPELPLDPSLITPVLAQDFISAAQSHMRAGDSEMVHVQLGQFPDKDFAVKLTIGLGKEFMDSNLIETALQLDESEPTKCLVVRAILDLALQRMALSEENAKTEVNERTDNQNRVESEKPYEDVANPAEDMLSRYTMQSAGQVARMSTRERERYTHITATLKSRGY